MLLVTQNRPQGPPRRILPAFSNQPTVVPIAGVLPTAQAICPCASLLLAVVRSGVLVGSSPAPGCWLHVVLAWPAPRDRSREQQAPPPQRCHVGAGNPLDERVTGPQCSLRPQLRRPGVHLGTLLTFAGFAILLPWQVTDSIT